MLELLSEINELEKTTIIMVTHDPMLQVIVIGCFLLKMESFSMKSIKMSGGKHFFNVF